MRGFEFLDSDIYLPGVLGKSAVLIFSPFLVEMD